MLTAFHEEFRADQVESWLRGPTWEQIRDAYSKPITLMAHHIFHSKRVDKWSNLILITSRAHVYVHADPIGATVACMLAVVNRGDEISQCREHWGAASNKLPLGWLHNAMANHEVPVWYMPMANELLRIFSCDVEECRGA